MSLDKTSREQIVASAAKIPVVMPLEESGDRLRRIVAGEPLQPLPPISESVAGLTLNPSLPEVGSDVVQPVVTENVSEVGSDVMDDWAMEFGDLTKVFPDAAEREKVRQLLRAAKGKRFADSARKQLAEIKNRIENQKNNNPPSSVRTELTQQQIDRSSKEIQHGNIG